MQYKAIVLDMDGTLVNSNHQVSPKNKEALLKIQEAGVKVVLASGRPTHGMITIAKELELDKYESYILSYNGGNITCMKTNEVIHSSALEKEIIHELYDFSREHKLGIMAYEDSSIITEDDDEYINLEVEINKMSINRIDNFKEYMQKESIKCLMTGHDDHVAKVEEILKEKYEGKLSICRSMPFFLECMPLNIDKGQSLDRLAKHIGITKEEMIACGDGYNDLTMIKYAGLGVAMSNGCDAVKEAADFITLSNDEDGVAHVIEKFILNK